MKKRLYLTLKKITKKEIKAFPDHGKLIYIDKGLGISIPKEEAVKLNVIGTQIYIGDKIKED